MAITLNRVFDFLDWKHLFIRFRPAYSTFEMTLFEKILPFLDKDRRNVFQSNLSEINSRTWGFEGSEAWYYKIRRFKPNSEREQYFKMNTESEKLFSGKIIFKDGTKININVHAFNRNFSHITFSADPRKFHKTEQFILEKR